MASQKRSGDCSAATRSAVSYDTDSDSDSSRTSSPRRRRKLVHCTWCGQFQTRSNYYQSIYAFIEDPALPPGACKACLLTLPVSKLVKQEERDGSLDGPVVSELAPNNFGLRPKRDTLRITALENTSRRARSQLARIPPVLAADGESTGCSSYFPLMFEVPLDACRPSSMEH